VTRGIDLYSYLNQTVFTFWMTLAIMYLHGFHCFTIRGNVFRFIQFHFCFVRHRMSVTTRGLHFIQGSLFVQFLAFCLPCAVGNSVRYWNGIFYALFTVEIVRLLSIVTSGFCCRDNLY
jgi:hypothetical protein